MPHPCDGGLTAACFAAAPQWAKQAFAVRLMNTLVPPAISRRLPKWKFSTHMIFPPGWQPGDPLPSGFKFNTSVLFPAGWQPGDPLPPGVTLPPGYSFPPGWQPGDPLPAGVIINTTVLFPPGWQPGDDLPDGFVWRPAIPPEARLHGISPPLYTEVFGPAPRAPYGGGGLAEYLTNIAAYNLDGWILKESAGWAAGHDAAAGDSVHAVDTASSYSMTARYDADTFTAISRTLLEFPLTGIPAAAEIVSAVLKIRGIYSADGKVCVQEGTFSGALAVADFSAFTGPSFAEAIWNRWDVDTDNVNEFTLSAAGLTFLQGRFGLTASLCLREYDHDFLDVQPDPPETIYNGMIFREYADQTLVPILTIVYKA